jgi:RNA polymerase sigma-70 factor (ECF subfamily)
VSKQADREIAMSAGQLPLGAGGLAAPARDRELVALCRSGDPDAFARLVALQEGMVFNLAARLLGDAEEARDVAQEVFLQVYRQLERFQGRSSLRTWIYRIVVNRCHNRRRFWQRRRREREQPLDEQLVSGSEAASQTGRSGTAASPFEHVRRRELAARVQAALLELRFDQRAVLVLREVEGLSSEEVAGALGIPEGTVKSRLSRARGALREKLSGLVEGGDWP